MKALLLHNYYQQPGGEDQSFADDAWLLESHGHEVLRFTLHNDAIGEMGRLEAARKTLFNRAVYRQLRALIRRERPEVMHCRNTFPLISPAAYYAAGAEGLPVVQTLSNYRLLCAGALLLRDGRSCEDCLGKRVPWPAVVHGCYHNQRAASAVVAAMLTVHRAMATWTRKVSRYVALTEFARRKFIQGGLPSGLICVKPNLVRPDPGPGDGRGGFALFAGRLSQEKGIETLLEAWSLLGETWPLKIVGDGPLAGAVREAAQRDPRIQWLGHRPLEQLLTIIGDARCLVFPSTCYETFGRTVIEAYAKATPAIVSRGGATAELVDQGRTGLLFDAGNAPDLAAKVRQLFGSPGQLAQMRQFARREYELKYGPEKNYETLMDIYRQALATTKQVVARPFRAAPTLHG